MFFAKLFRPFCGVLFLFAISVLSISSVRAQQPSTANHLEGISWLVGQWDAVEPPVAGVPVLTKLTAQWNSDHSAIELTCTSGPAAQKPSTQYSATYNWDPQAKKIAVKQIYPNGDHFDGFITSGGSDFDQSGKLTRANGTSQNLQMNFNFWITGTFDLTITPPSSNSAAGGPTAAPLVFLREDSLTNAAAGASELNPPPAKQVADQQPTSTQSE